MATSNGKDTGKATHVTHYDFPARGITVIPQKARKIKAKQTHHRLTPYRGKTVMKKQTVRTKELVDNAGIDEWFSCKIRAWGSRGRLTDEGVLKMSGKPHRMLYARKIKRLWPKLSIQECHKLAIEMYGPTRYKMCQAGMEG